jgi:hypothetical protein
LLKAAFTGEKGIAFGILHGGEHRHCATTELQPEEIQMKRYVIEREVPGIGQFSLTELCGAARASNQALATIGPSIQWQHSYVADGKTFCIYLAESEEEIARHSELSGIPVSKITEVSQIIDPLTANN